MYMLLVPRWWKGDEKDLVQSDPEIDEDSDEETLMIKEAFFSIQ